MQKKKLVAILVTLAMLLSTFGALPVFAAATTVGYLAGESKVSGEASILEVVVNPGANYDKVVIDFSGKDFKLLGMEDAATWTPAILNDAVTLTGAVTNLAKTFKVKVQNPATNGAAKTGPTVTSYNGAAVVLADTSTLKVEYKVEAGAAEVLTGTITTIGVTVKEGSAVTTDNIYYNVVKAGVSIASGYTNGGVFNAGISFDTAENVTYSVYVKEGSAPADNGSDYDGVATIKTKHNVQVSAFTVKYGETKTITGSVKNGKGEAVISTVLVKLGAATIASTTTAADGSFAVTATFNDAADYVITTPSGIEYVKGTVAPNDTSLEVKVDKTSVTSTIAAVPIELSATLPDGSDADTDRDPAPAAKFIITGVSVDKATLAAAGGTVTGKDEVDGKWTKLEAVDTGVDGKVTITAKYMAAGTAAVKAEYENIADAGNTTAPDYVATTSYAVTAPAKFNWTVTVAGASAPDMDATVADAITVAFTDVNGDGAGVAPKLIKEVKVTAEGPGITAKTTPDSTTTASFVTIAAQTANQAGTVTVKVVAEFHDGSKVEETKTIKVKGYNYTVSPVSAVVDEVKELKVVVTDGGVAVNNAKVTFAGVALQEKNAAGTWVAWGGVINGATENINNGTYAKEVKFTAVGTLTATIQSAALVNKAVAEIKVEGKPVYTVSAPATVVVGKSESLKFTVKDAEGKAAVTSAATVKVNDVVKAYNLIDTNSDSVYDTYEIPAYAAAAAGELKLSFTTDAGTKAGSAVINAVAAKVDSSITDAKFTDSVKEEIVLKVTDPRDATAINGATTKIKVTSIGASVKVYSGSPEVLDATLADAASYVYSAAAASNEIKFKVMAADVVEDPAKAPQVKIEVSIDNGVTYSEVAVYDVVPMTITATPSEIKINTDSTVTVEVKDAHGKAVASKTVTLTGAVSATGVTGTDGKVTFMVRANATGPITISVPTDGAAATSEVKSVITGGATGSASVSLQIGNTTAVANGTLSQLDVAPFIEGGRTMVPFRYLGEALGAYVEFVAPNKVIYRLRVDATTVNVVELTIGSTIAKVNGVAVTLDAPAKIVNGRTVVPLRFLGEAFGYYVDYNFSTQVITLTK